MLNLGARPGGPYQLAQTSVPTGTATAVGALSSSIPHATFGCLVQAIAANTAKVYVGGSGVLVTTGVELGAGDSVFLPVQDPANIFSISGSSGQKLQVTLV